LPLCLPSALPTLTLAPVLCAIVLACYCILSSPRCPLPCACSPQARIHLIIDVAETPRQQHQLHVGEICQYRGRSIVCPQAGQGAGLALGQEAGQATAAAAAA